METLLKKIKKILLMIPFLIICLYFKNVSAEDLVNIYTLSSNNQNITDISNNSFGESPTSLNFNLFDKYNYTYQNSSSQVMNRYLLLYNKLDNYYILLAIRQPSITYTKIFLDTSVTTPNKYTSLLKLCNDDFSSCTNFSAYYKYIYNNINTRSKISNLGFTLTADFNLDNFYISTTNTSNVSNPQSTGYANYYSKIIADNIDNFYLIDSSDPFYIDNTLQEKHTYSELNPIPDEPDTPIIPPYNFNNNKYYVPNYEKGNCVEILDKDTIRVFKDENTDFYTDFYITSNYISKTGQVEIDYVKNCSTLEFTNIRYYGNDFPQIAFITLLLIVFSVGFPYILYKRFRKR